jgi:hypothetical protein
MEVKMKKAIVLFCLLIYPVFLYPWGATTHRGMTRAAAKTILKMGSKPVTNLSVHIYYDLNIDFFQTILKGTGKMEGMLLSSIGAIIDKSISDDKIKVDSTKIYKNTTEIKMMAEAGQDPDDFDKKTGVFGESTGLIGHIYAPNGLGFADFMTKFFYDKAIKEYNAGKHQRGLAYLGYATHYIVDVAIPVHAEADFLNQKNLQLQWDLHNKLEDWVSDNWNTYFQVTADSAAKVPMPACDIGAMVRGLGLETYPTLAEWYQAWGLSSNNAPKNLNWFIDLVKESIWRCVPRVSGLFLKFRDAVGYKP